MMTPILTGSGGSFNLYPVWEEQLANLDWLEGSGIDDEPVDVLLMRLNSPPPPAPEAAVAAGPDNAGLAAAAAAAAAPPASCFNMYIDPASNNRSSSNSPSQLAANTPASGVGWNNTLPGATPPQLTPAGPGLQHLPPAAAAAGAATAANMTLPHTLAPPAAGGMQASFGGYPGPVVVPSLQQQQQQQQLLMAPGTGQYSLSNFPAAAAAGGPINQFSMGAMSAQQPLLSPVSQMPMCTPYAQMDMGVLSTAVDLQRGGSTYSTNTSILPAPQAYDGGVYQMPGAAAAPSPQQGLGSLPQAPMGPPGSLPNAGLPHPSPQQGMGLLPQAPLAAPGPLPNPGLPNPSPQQGWNPLPQGPQMVAAPGPLPHPGMQGGSFSMQGGASSMQGATATPAAPQMVAATGPLPHPGLQGGCLSMHSATPAVSQMMSAPGPMPAGLQGGSFSLQDATPAVSQMMQGTAGYMLQGLVASMGTAGTMGASGATGTAGVMDAAGYMGAAGFMGSAGVMGSAALNQPALNPGLHPSMLQQGMPLPQQQWNQQQLQHMSGCMDPSALLPPQAAQQQLLSNQVPFNPLQQQQQQPYQIQPEVFSGPQQQQQQQHQWASQLPQGGMMPAAAATGHGGLPGTQDTFMLQQQQQQQQQKEPPAGFFDYTTGFPDAGGAAVHRHTTWRLLQRVRIAFQELKWAKSVQEELDSGLQVSPSDRQHLQEIVGYYRALYAGTLQDTTQLQIAGHLLGDWKSDKNKFIPTPPQAGIAVPSCVQLYDHYEPILKNLQSEYLAVIAAADEAVMVATTGRSFGTFTGDFGSGKDRKLAIQLEQVNPGALYVHPKLAAHLPAASNPAALSASDRLKALVAPPRKIAGRKLSDYNEAKSQLVQELHDLRVSYACCVAAADWPRQSLPDMAQDKAATKPDASQGLSAEEMCRQQAEAQQRQQRPEQRQQQWPAHGKLKRMQRQMNLQQVMQVKQQQLDELLKQKPLPRGWKARDQQEEQQQQQQHGRGRAGAKRSRSGELAEGPVKRHKAPAATPASEPATDAGAAGMPMPTPVPQFPQPQQLLQQPLAAHQLQYSMSQTGAVKQQFVDYAAILQQQQQILQQQALQQQDLQQQALQQQALQQQALQQQALQQQALQQQQQQQQTAFSYTALLGQEDDPVFDSDPATTAGDAVDVSFSRLSAAAAAAAAAGPVLGPMLFGSAAAAPAAAAVPAGAGAAGAALSPSYPTFQELVRDGYFPTGPLTLQVGKQGLTISVTVKQEVPGKAFIEWMDPRLQPSETVFFNLSSLLKKALTVLGTNDKSAGGWAQVRYDGRPLNEFRKAARAQLAAQYMGQ